MHRVISVRSLPVAHFVCALFLGTWAVASFFFSAAYGQSPPAGKNYAEKNYAGKNYTGKNYTVESAVFNQCKQADDLISTGKYDQAKTVLLSAAAADPTSYSEFVHLSLARSYKGQKDYPSAILEAQTALKFNAQSANALYTTALIYSESHQYDQAIKYLEKSINATQDEAFKTQARQLILETKAYKSLKDGLDCLDKGRDSDAKRLFEKAATYDPCKVSGRVHASLAYVLRRMGKPEKAIVEGEKSLTYEPSSANTMYTIGISYQDIGRFDDAIGWLKRYVAAESDEARRRSASDFIRELSDDQVKLNSAANSKSDYFEQLKANHDVTKWPREQLPIKFYIAPGTGVPGYRPIFRSFVIRALDSWYEASGKKVSYTVVTDPKAADVKVKFTENEIAIQESGRRRQKAGLTSLHFDDDNKLGGTVAVRTVLAFDPKQLIQDGQCATICMHEIGHSFGLGHSTLYRDVMYFGSSSEQPGLPSSRDKATIKRLYEDYPQTIVSAANKPSPSSQTIQFLPPPIFLPPKPADTNKLPLPLFVPPPIKSEKEKLQPPLFMPPPIAPASTRPASANWAGGKTAAPVTPPLFMPPPIKKSGAVKAQPPMFLPPPK